MLCLIVALIFYGFARADYDCLCSYNVEKPVFISVRSLLLLTGFVYGPLKHYHTYIHIVSKFSVIYLFHVMIH